MVEAPKRPKKKLSEEPRKRRRKSNWAWDRIGMFLFLVLGRQPELYSPKPGQPCALCQWHGCHSSLLQANEPWKRFWNHHFQVEKWHTVALSYFNLINYVPVLPEYTELTYRLCVSVRCVQCITAGHQFLWVLDICPLRYPWFLLLQRYIICAVTLQTPQS